MNVKTAAALATEQERQQRLAELSAEHDPTWLEQYKPGSFGCHELLDRASLLGDTVEQCLLDHPACVQNRDWYALAERAVDALRALYQRIGAEHLETENPASGKASAH
jgi:hypothetical protein